MHVPKYAKGRIMILRWNLHSSFPILTKVGKVVILLDLLLKFDTMISHFKFLSKHHDICQHCQLYVLRGKFDSLSLKCFERFFNMFSDCIILTFTIKYLNIVKVFYCFLLQFHCYLGFLDISNHIWCLTTMHTINDVTPLWVNSTKYKISTC